MNLVFTKGPQNIQIQNAWLRCVLRKSVKQSPSHDYRAACSRDSKIKASGCLVENSIKNYIPCTCEAPVPRRVRLKTGCTPVFRRSHECNNAQLRTRKQKQCSCYQKEMASAPFAAPPVAVLTENRLSHFRDKVDDIILREFHWRSLLDNDTKLL